MAQAAIRPAAPSNQPPEAGAQKWLEAQRVNALRHTGALHPFSREEFGDRSASPTDGQLRAVNGLVTGLQRTLGWHAHRTSVAALRAARGMQTSELSQLLRAKEDAGDAARSVEKVWDFYRELFSQRLTRFGPWLLSCDRIALDCYQAFYTNLPKSRSIPAPPPFCYMRTGFSPSTFRRGIPLTALGKQINPFPLVQIPYHRLVNPWTLGAVLHEVSHNLQNDLGLQELVPRMIARKLLTARLPPAVAKIWAQWNREIYADLSGLLLGGPAVVISLMDVIGRTADMAMNFHPEAPHPTPYLRLFLSTELLKKMGFPRTAATYEKLWRRMYPSAAGSKIPAHLSRTAAVAIPIVVRAVCFTAYQPIGTSLARVVQFRPNDMRMIQEAARRIAEGADPGIIPERFLVGASRVALDGKLAAPETIAGSFYRELARR